MSENPLLTKSRIPGTTYRLPSRGLFYHDDEIDHDVTNAEIIVNPMRTTEELLLNSPDKLLSGQAIVEVFEHCIPQIKRPMELLAKDVDFLLTCLRIVSFGPTMEITYTHICDDAGEHTYSINLEDIIRGVREIDPTSLESKFKMTLDNGQVLTIRPPRYDRVMKLYQSLSNFDDKEMSQEVLKANIIANLTDMIANVDEVTNPEFISEWLEDLKAGFVHDIQEFVEIASDWGIEQDTTIVCQDCNEEVPITVPSNPISFFT